MSSSNPDVISIRSSPTPSVESIEEVNNHPQYRNGVQSSSSPPNIHGPGHRFMQLLQAAQDADDDRELRERVHNLESRAGHLGSSPRFSEENEGDGQRNSSRSSSSGTTFAARSRRNESNSNGSFTPFPRRENTPSPPHIESGYLSALLDFVADNNARRIEANRSRSLNSRSSSSTYTQAEPNPTRTTVEELGSPILNMESNYISSVTTPNAEVNDTTGYDADSDDQIILPQPSRRNRRIARLSSLVVAPNSISSTSSSSSSGPSSIITNRSVLSSSRSGSHHSHSAPVSQTETHFSREEEEEEEEEVISQQPSLRSEIHATSTSSEKSRLDKENDSHTTPFESLKQHLFDRNGPLSNVDIKGLIQELVAVLDPSSLSSLLGELPNQDISFFSDENTVFWRAVNQWQRKLQSGEFETNTQASKKRRVLPFKDETYLGYWEERVRRSKRRTLRSDSHRINDSYPYPKHRQGKK